MTSIRRLGSPMCSPDCMITPQSGSTSSCHGIGVRRPGLPKLPDSFTPADLEFGAPGLVRLPSDLPRVFTGCIPLPERYDPETIDAPSFDPGVRREISANSTQGAVKADKRCYKSEILPLFRMMLASIVGPRGRGNDGSIVC